MSHLFPKRKDYFLLLSDTISNIENITNISSRIDKIKNYIVSEISNGNLLEKEFLYLGILIKRQKIDISDSYQIYELKKNLSNLLKKFPDNSKEIFAINDNIFLLEMLNGNFENGLKNYIKNILILDFHAGINLKYTKFLPEIITLLTPNPNFILDTIKELFTSYLSFKKKQRRSILNWVWQCIWASQIILHKRKEVYDIYPILKLTLYTLIEKEKVDEVMIFSMFIVNIMINVIEGGNITYLKLQKEITEPCCNLYKNWIKKNENLLIKPKNKSSNNKIKIALVRPNLGYWSPFILEFSLLKSLKQDENFNKKYEIGFYSFDSLELWAGRGDDIRCLKLINKEKIPYFSPVKNHNIKFGYYTNYLKKVLDFRESLIKDDIDIIIFSDHLYSIGEFLFLSRTAPLQLYWNHNGSLYNMPEIDKIICHYIPSNNSKNIEVFKVQKDEIFYKGTEEEKKLGIKIKSEILKKYGKEKIILGSIGRLTKVDSWEYLKTIREIMKNNPNTIYLACGNGDILSIKEKLKKLDIDESRFLFPGFVNPHVYDWVIDIYLDTFPTIGGESVAQFKAKGKIAIIKREFKSNDISLFARKVSNFLRKINYSKTIFLSFIDFFTFIFITTLPRLTNREYIFITDLLVKNYYDIDFNSNFKNIINYFLKKNEREKYYKVEDRDFIEILNKLIKSYRKLV